MNKYYIYSPVDGEAAFWMGVTLKEAKSAAQHQARVLRDAGCTHDESYVSVRELESGNEVIGYYAE